MLSQPPSRPRAFTLIEMLIVVGIIAILMSIVLFIGVGVRNSSKKQFTLTGISMLDKSLVEYVAAEGDAIPPPIHAFTDRASNVTSVFAAADAKAGSAGPLINSVGWYIKQSESVPGARSSIKSNDQRMFRQYSTEQIGGSSETVTEPELATVFDGWGNPVRYVHPKFDGLIFGSYPNVGGSTTADVDLNKVVGPAPGGLQFAFTKIRRSPDQKDADGGECPGNMPYFYSAGPDGDPSTTEDNVYSIMPRFVAQ